MTEIDFLKELSNMIFIYRKKKNRTLEEICSITGNNTKYLRALELGKNDPQITSYFKIAKELGVPYGDIEKVISNYFKQ